MSEADKLRQYCKSKKWMLSPCSKRGYWLIDMPSGRPTSDQLREIRNDLRTIGYDYCQDGYSNGVYYIVINKQNKTDNEQKTKK